MSIVVVIAEPDDRPSSLQLRRICEDLGTRSDLDVAVWFLRDYHDRRWPGSHNVDGLRTWWVNRALERVGAGRLAGAARGRRLRRWFRRAAPDLVLFDDGVGQRLLEATADLPLQAVRLNPEPGEGYGFEAPFAGRPDITVSFLPEPAGITSPSGRWILASPFPEDSEGAVDPGPATQRATRERLGLPVDRPLVVGWGEDGWIDGSELFIRTLWYLADRHGVEAHGLWIGPLADPVEVVRLRSEAARCGVGDRLHLSDDRDPAAPWCGDVAYLPSRVPSVDLRLALVAMAWRLPVVTFRPAPDVPGVEAVDLLDLPAAASEIARVLEDPPRFPAVELGAQRTADRLLEAMRMPGP